MTNSENTAPLTVREALRLIWETDRYPILANEDWRAAETLRREAIARAAQTESAKDFVRYRLTKASPL